MSTEELPMPTKAELGRSFRDAKAYGKRPSIAINNSSVVVEVCEKYWYLPDPPQALGHIFTTAHKFFGGTGNRTKMLQYRVSQLDHEVGKITWGKLGAKGSDGLHYYAVGCRPHVALNNENIVVAVHENQDRCLYRVGSVNQGSGTIEWSKANPTPRRFLDVEYAKGHFPGVALLDNNTVILTYCEDKYDGIASYIVGDINTKEMIFIQRSDSPQKRNRILTNVMKLTIAANNKGSVVVVYQTTNPHENCCMAGTLRGEHIEWEYQQITKLLTSGVMPSCPAVSFNSQGYVVVVHAAYKFSSFPKQYIKTTCNVGLVVYDDRNRTCKMEIFSKCKKEYDNGCCPAVAIDDANTIVEIHESDVIPQTQLHYHVGRLFVIETEHSESKKRQPRINDDDIVDPLLGM